jgi:hypothetical protein
MGTLALGSCGGAAHLHIDIARLNWQCFFTCAAQGIVQDAIAFDPHYYKDLYSNDIFFDSEIYIYILHDHGGQRIGNRDTLVAHACLSSFTHMSKLDVC